MDRGNYRVGTTYGATTILVVLYILGANGTTMLYMTDVKILYPLVRAFAYIIFD